MKIIFSNYDDMKNPYYAGGGARAIHEVAKRLAKRFPVTVITGKYPGCRNEEIDGVAYVRVGTELWGPKAGQLIYQLCLLPRVWADGYDLWIESFTPPFSTSFLPIFTKKPVIGLVHMLAAEDMTRKYKIPIFGAVEKQGLRLYRNLIVLTDREAEKIKAINPDAKILVIPNGVTVAEKPGIKAVKKHILFLGRIEVDQKGLGFLVRAYAKIAGRIKYPLVIAGSGEKSEMDKLKMMIEKSGLKNSVIPVGRVEGKKKEALLAGAVFVVIPSRYETFSITALEAMAAGIGIITFDIVGLKWIPETIAVKAPGFDVFKLASLMLELSTNKRKLDLMGKAGKSFVRQFDWEQISDKYAKCIYKYIGKKHE